MNKNLLYATTMIPILTDDGFVAHPLAEERALKTQILTNYLNDFSDLKSLVGITKKVININNQNLKTLLYERMEYLGFISERMEIKTDMSFREKVICFCSNFMNYFDTNDESFYEILEHLI